MQEVLNNVKKYYRNGKITFLVIALAVAMVIFGLCYYIVSIKDDWVIILFAFLPLISTAISMGIGILIWLHMHSKIKKVYNSDTLDKYNSSATAEERQIFIKNSNALLKRQNKADRWVLFIIFAVAIVVIDWIGALLEIFPNWLLSAINAIAPFIGIPLGYKLMYFNYRHYYRINYCEKCFKFNAIQYSSYNYKDEKLEKEYDWEDHYGTTGEIYSNGEKVGSVYGRTGSTRYSRQPVKKYYRDTSKCKYCGYSTSSERTRTEYGKWERD